MHNIHTYTYIHYILCSLTLINVPSVDYDYDYGLLVWKVGTSEFCALA